MKYLRISTDKDFYTKIVLFDDSVNSKLQIQIITFLCGRDSVLYNSYHSHLILSPLDWMMTLNTGAV